MFSSTRQPELLDIFIAPLERAGLEYMVTSRNIPPDIAEAQIIEVRRRIAQVESGEVTLIPGEEALAHVRRILRYRVETQLIDDLVE